MNFDDRMYKTMIEMMLTGSNVSVRGLARRLGVSRQRIYNHLDRKGLR